MNEIYTKTVGTSFGEKSIKVCLGDIRELDQPVDVLTVSAFFWSYEPTPRTMIGALNEKGISVQSLSASPEMDLRKTSNIWLSRRIGNAALPVSRIGCIEMSGVTPILGRYEISRNDVLTSVQTYFRMLDIASLSGIKIETVALPIIGAGCQAFETDLIVIPLINECVQYLKQNRQVREIRLIERNPEKAHRLVSALESSYSMQRSDSQQNAVLPTESKGRVFISYSSADKNIADNLCFKLESAGMKAWYAPRDIHNGDYASAIVRAISECEFFVVILSTNSLKSNHVLNEVDLAFQEMSSRKMKFCPIKLDEEELGPAFRYYLSRQHWMDAHIPPLEKRLEEFVESIAKQ